MALRSSRGGSYTKIPSAAVKKSMTVIKEESPTYLVFEEQGYLSIELYLKVGVETRPIRLTITFQVLIVPGITPAPLTTPTLFNSQTITYITTDAVASAALGARVTGIQAPLVTVPLNLIVSSLDQYMFKSMREAQGKQVIYRKLKLKLFKSKRSLGPNIAA